MSKGKKVCPECNTSVGVRTYDCPECEYTFPMKKARKTAKISEVKDWRALEKGDYIKVMQGSGPYWRRDVDGMEETIYTGYKGIFKVKAIHKDGILAISVKGLESNSVAFIYMGKHEHYPQMGNNYYRDAHKIKRVRPKGKR